MTLTEFSQLDTPKKKELLTKCCGAPTWVQRMISVSETTDIALLENVAEEIWYECTEHDWREAFEHHPKIGNIQSLKEKFANTTDWASHEQSGVESATDDVLVELTKANEAYEQKFGYIFIVCATGKSASQMLAILKNRLPNAPAEEIKIAAKEQFAITKLRLQKLFL